MAKLLKRILSVGISAAIALSLVTLPVSAEENIPGWEVLRKGDVQATIELDREEKYSGEAALKVVNHSPAVGDVYVMVSTTVPMEANRRYNIEAKVKSESSSTLVLVVRQGWEVLSLTPFGKTYDWTNFEYTYVPKETKAYSFAFLVEGATSGAWLDDFQITDIETGERLVSNPGFEGDISGDAMVEGTEDSSLYGVYSKIKSSDSYPEEDMTKVRGGFKYMPVYNAENIVTDGNISDWDSYPVLTMPTLPTQYQVYLNDGMEKDVECECKFAQDEQNFYMMLRVKDNNFTYFTGVDAYWRGDSIQMAISSLDDTYGTEIGFIHNPETGKGEIYSPALTSNQLENMLIATSQEGEYTVYEMAIPWDTIFRNGRPEQLLFNFLINDNDGQGRRYCAELAPGISEGKTNVLFPTLENLSGQKDWYAWIQGDRQIVTENEYTYEYYIVNSGDEKSFTVTNNQTGEKEEITIPAKTGIRRSFAVKYDTAGENVISIDISSGDEAATSQFKVKVSRKPPSAEYAQELADNLRKQAKEIKKLLDKCHDKGIPTDYQLVDYNILSDFAGYVEEDIQNKDLDRVYYTETTTNELYEKTKAELEALLSGEAEPVTVPHYITSKARIDGATEFVTAEVGGKTEERPFFFIGYGHGGEVLDMIPKYNEWAVNAIQTEVGPEHVMMKENAWSMMIKGDHKFDFKPNAEDKLEGNTSLEITYNSQQEAEHYICFYQTVPVTPGKTYVLTGNVKSEYCENAWVSAENWNNVLGLKGEYDWKEFKKEYIAPADATSTTVRITVDDITRGFLLDKFSFKEKGSDVELLQDPSFENMSYDVENYSLNDEVRYFERIIESLENAEKHNVAVSLLVSPHYFLSDYATVNNLNVTTDGFLNYNVNAPKARAIIEKYLRELIPLVADYPALHDICISNEPQFEINNCGDFFLGDWHNYLKDVYGNDISKLNEAYGTQYTDFAEVDMTNSVEAPAKQYDYKRLNDMMFADWHRFMADIIHELAPDIPLHSKIMGYTASQYGHRPFLQNNGTGYHEYYDFLDYHGCDYWRYEEDEYKPLVKTMWYDYMSSYGIKPVMNSEDHILPDRGTNYELCVSDYVAQDLWQGAIHGRVSSIMWIWRRSANPMDDARSSVLYRPDTLSKISDVSLDLNRFAYEVTALQKQQPEVGVIYSESNMINNTASMVPAYEAYAAAVSNGKRVKFITDYNTNSIYDMKLVIVPNVKYIKGETLNALKAFIEKGGKVLVIGENTLTLNEHSLPNNADTVRYIMENSKVVSHIEDRNEVISPTAEEYLDLVGDMLEELGIDYVKVIDADTGKRALDIEINVGVTDGKVLINLSNTGEAKNLKVYAGDTLVTGATELRSGSVYDDTIELGKYMVALLKTKLENTFIDTYGHWAENDISELGKKGIVSGMTESLYVPNGTTTRAEFLSLLVRASEMEAAVYAGDFDDVAADSWYSGSVASALSNGIIQGGSNFRPDDKITRGEMCDMLVKCYEYRYGTIADDTKISFTDKISNSEAVEKAVSAGLMVGYADGEFKENNNATRAEAAAVVKRFIKE